MIKPMLATKINMATAKWPCCIQPKLDGVRCLVSRDEVHTRNQKPHKDHIIDMLAGVAGQLPPGFYLDGELMLPKPFTFQQTVSAVKKLGENQDKLRFHVYDIVDVDSPLTHGFLHRCRWIHDYMVDGVTEEVETRFCLSADVFMTKASEYIEAGYEGAMYRKVNGPYVFGRRGGNLLKYKEFQDDEYEITGVNEGQGRDAGTPVFVCRTDEGKTFNCRPKGSYEWRHRAWDNRESLIGKTLTVRFQELTDDDIPRFPVGVEIRDYE